MAAKCVSTHVKPGENPAPTIIETLFSSASGFSFNNPAISLILSDVEITDIPFLIALCATSKCCPAGEVIIRIIVGFTQDQHGIR